LLSTIRIVAIRNPERHVRKAPHRGRDHASQSLLLLLARATHIYSCSSRTSHWWWITQSTQHHRRGCNSISWSSTDKIVLVRYRYLCITPTTINRHYSTMHNKPSHKIMGIAHNWRNARKCLHFCILII